jgi:drug/metabolite transporter (DMT)-like permease
MTEHSIKYDLYLLSAALIWGFSFVAQRIGAEYTGPLIFNGIRFALGSVSLIPLIIYNDIKGSLSGGEYHQTLSYSLYSGVIAGAVSFIAVTLQQISLKDTSAGKVAFITGLYILIVPILGKFLKHRSSASTWLAALLAAVGLYLLCVTDKFTINRSDLLVLLSTFFWAIHILLIDHFTKKADVLKLSSFQFATCAALSLLFGLIFEHNEIPLIIKAGIPILYGGVLSVGVA